MFVYYLNVAYEKKQCATTFSLFRHLGSQLAELEKLIDKMMQADFIRYVTTDLNRPLSDTQLLVEEVSQPFHDRRKE